MPSVDVHAGTLYSTSLAAQKIRIFMDEGIKYEETSASRLEHWIRKLNPVQIVPGDKTEWMEMKMYPVTMLTTGASAGTTIPVDHPEYAHRDQVLFNTVTREAYLMNEDVGGTGTAGSVTVINHAGTGNITTATVAGQLIQIGPEAHAEGEAIPPAYSHKPEFYSARIMQGDKTFKVSDRAQHGSEYGLDQYKIDMKQGWLNRKVRLNMWYLNGRPVVDDTSGTGRRISSTGIDESITTNRVDCSLVGGILTNAMLGELLRVTKRTTSSSSTKLGIAGQNAQVSLSAIPPAQIYQTVMDTVVGTRVNTVRTPFGDLAFDYDQSLSDEFGEADKFVILDPKCPIRLQQVGLPEHAIMDVYGSTDPHNLTVLYTGTWGLKFIQEYLSAFIHGIA